MPLPSFPRRQALVLLGALPLAGLVRAAATTPGPAPMIEVQFLITRERRQPSGDMERRDFQNAVRVMSGQSVEVDFHGEYRVHVSATDTGAAADVRIKLWDNQEDPARALVGEAGASVPFDGEAALTLLKSSNVVYPVHLKVSRSPAHA